jgi:ABC-type antimicrobial peptide transport system permease subunit
MLKNYLLITFRSMMKSKVYLFINILGMAISIGCCIVAWYNYDFNASFDSVHEKAVEIYRVNMVRRFQNNLSEYGVVPIPLGEVVRQNAKDVDAQTRYSSGYADLRIGDEIFDTGLSYVDPEFFDLFTFEFIEGSASAIQDKTRVLISDELAIRLFGNEKALGKEITHILQGDAKREFVVGGVFRLPPTNSSFNDPAYALYENYWDTDPALERGATWVYRNTLFLQVSDPSRLASIEAQLKPYSENNNKVREDFIVEGFKLDPLLGMAVRDEYADRPATWTRDASPLAAVVGCAVMAIFVLLISCFNLTNTAIAISSRRLKEIGIRKVMGSMRKQLIFQFIGETMVVCFMALVIGMALADLLLIPAFNSLWPEMKLTTNYLGDDFILVMAGILAFTGLLAGSYPAFYISKFQPTAILKGKLRFGGTNAFTRILLSLQFMISLIGVVCSIAFVDNARYQKEVDLGFNQHGVLCTWVNGEDEYDALRVVLEQNPDISSIAGTEHSIFMGAYNDPVKHEGNEIEVDIMNVGENYLPTVGMTLLKGRDFVKDSETDRRESAIITPKVAELFGWDDPIGKEIVWMDTVKLYVVGMVKEVYNNGLWREMEPMVLRYTFPDKYKILLLNAPVDKLPSVNQYMEARWKEVFPNRKFNSVYLDAPMVEANTVNNNIVKMFIFLGAVAMMLSVTGLFTMVSLNIIRKMKEIGVRKVMGASIANISRIINAEFAIVLGVACLLGAAGGIWMSEMLMDSIWDFYQKVTAITLTLSCLLLLAASALTVGFKTYNTARVNPATVLRDE